MRSVLLYLAISILSVAKASPEANLALLELRTNLKLEERFKWPWQDESSSATETATTSSTSDGPSTTDTTEKFKWPWQDDSSSASGSSATETGSDTSSTSSSNSASITSSDSSISASASASASASKSSSQSSSSSSDTSEGNSGGFGNIFDSSRNYYQPYETDCPSDSIIREASELSTKEAEYVSGRHAKTNENLIDFLLNRANLTDFDAQDFVDNAPSNITIGIAFSGGGYRAMLNGAGQLLALDDRFEPSVQHGLGGLLQSATYIVGLSGGNWLVGSIATNDFVSVKDILSNKLDIWNLDDSIFNAGGWNIVKTADYYKKIDDSVLAKEDYGFPITITDVWGRALSSQFYNNTDYGINYTFLGIVNQGTFKSHDMPYPIVVSNGRNPDTTIISGNSTIFEMSPYELGSWDPSLKAFAQMKYIGSYLENGTNSSGKCIVNFDNAGYIMGTSSSLFNAILYNIDQRTNLPDIVLTPVKKLLGMFSDKNEDIADYSPNPFYNTNYGEGNITKSNTLHLVDGGEDGQNVPFYPLIQQDRKVDVIFAFDNSADTNHNWPNGSSIANTFIRQFEQQGSGTPFPYVPTVAEFVDEGYDSKPGFFGCYADNLTDLITSETKEGYNVTDIPLIVQFSNSRYSYNSNTSTFKMSYDDKERLSIITNGFEVATRGNYSDDSEFAKCVGCAIIRRTQERLGEEQSDECKSCFEKYCWKGGMKDSPTNSSSSSSSSSSPSSSSSEASGTSGSSSSSSDVSNSGSSSTSSSTKHGSAASINPLKFLVFIITSLFMLL